MVFIPQITDFLMTPTQDPWYDRLDSLIRPDRKLLKHHLGQTTCLTPRARALRCQLAACSVRIAVSGEHYISNTLGDRLYCSAKAERLIRPLLEELGLNVSHEEHC